MMNDYCEKHNCIILNTVFFSHLFYYKQLSIILQYYLSFSNRHIKQIQNRYSEKNHVFIKLFFFCTVIKMFSLSSLAVRGNRSTDIRGRLTRIINILIKNHNPSLIPHYSRSTIHNSCLHHDSSSSHSLAIVLVLKYISPRVHSSLFFLSISFTSSAHCSLRPDMF